MKLVYTVRYYLAAAAILAVTFGSFYVLLQQYGRMQANDTPTILATQAAKAIDAYGTQVVNNQPVDIASSLVSFVIVYDKQGKAIAGTGYLDKKLAVVSKGVLENSKSGTHTVTWQPKSGVRVASAVVSTKQYYVLGGQSLKLTENRASTLFWLTGFGYAVSLAALAAAAYVLEFRLKAPKKK